ncbi:MAG TPA: DNA methyltransferase [Pyrinomonadaceae bacterium]
MPHSEKTKDVQGFISRWKESGAAERANYQLFLSELCDLLEVERPAPSKGGDDERNAYVFERSVTFHNGDGSTSNGRIDLYKRGCFVLEAKQGSEQTLNETPLFEDEKLSPARSRKGSRGAAVRGTRGWDVKMRAARGQAEQYVRALPASEGNPPFLIVTDVGHSFELYSDFSRAGKTYVPFPDARSHRILIDDLTREEVRERLRQIWTDPMALDPSRRSARVTRDVAAQLAALARSLEESGYGAERVANFLMRAIFTMFAEDVQLIPPGSFTNALEEVKRDGVEIFPEMIGSLWSTMNAGGFSTVIKKHVIQFNGGLFEECEALPLTAAQLDLLIEASRADWKDVEPAIFGTLLERALDPRERHKLGAHYTPRAYVERLVMPTIIEPLRQEWEAVLAAAVTLANSGKLKEAAEETKAFHRRLCRVRVLDPACGSGNFLYVTLEHLKRLEGEVLDALHGFGDSQGVLEDTGLTVDPHQLLGIEVNPRAAAITDLVLWIGYLQWHFRTRGEVLPPQPVIKKFHNIETRDAILAYDGVEEVRDETGQIVTRWDGRTTKKHPVTNEDVPDETARVPLLNYVNPRKAEWPEADYVIGNPPFVGNWRMRSVLGDGYVEALRQIYDDVPETSDYVMYWWNQAAHSTRSGKTKRFGLIATNSLRQTFNRRVIQAHLSAKKPLSLVFAIPDHPWVDSEAGAAVRISMTVGAAGEHEGILQKVVNETAAETDSLNVDLSQATGKIHSDLTIGADVVGTQPLKANSEISSPGVKLHGAGFIVTQEEAATLGLGRISGLENYIRLYRNGRDLTDTPRNVMVIDLFGLSIDDVRIRFPEVYQRVLERVKPERDQNNRATYRDNWWIFGEPRANFRPALVGLERYIATVETSKHRFFLFLDKSILPDNRLVNFALDDAYYLGVLSSRLHIVWALAAGGTLEDRPVYNKTRCFDPFPFPDCTEQQKARIRELGESLDAHRKRQQEQHPQLTITEMYNVLEKLRAGESLTDRERTTHEQGLVSVLKQLHDELDLAVFDAYGWPPTLTDEEILERLVQLNAERAAEERKGLVRWLRPEFQKPAEGVAATFSEEFAAAAPAVTSKQEKQPWPKTIPEQARAVRLALASERGVVTPQQLARNFTRARVERIEELLQTLVSLGQAREVGEGGYTS